MRRCAALLLAFPLLLSGCAGRKPLGSFREIDQMVLVETMGVDRRDGLFTVTVSTAAEEGQVLLKTPAVTLSRALKEMQDYTEKKYIFYGHTRHLLLGPSVLEEELARCLEFVERDGELRMDTKLFALRGDSAEDAIAVPDGEESVGDLLDSLEKDVALLSESHVFTCGETAEALAERGSVLVSALRLAEPENILNGENRKTLLSAGYAVVTERGLACWLDTDLARGANLLMELSDGDLIEAPDGRGGWFAAALTGSKAVFLPKFEEGELSGLHIRLELRCRLSEMQQPLDLREEGVIRELEEGIASVEAWRVEEVLRLSQLLGADFCGLERQVRRAASVRFDRMNTSWRELFPTLPVTAEVAVKLTRSYEGTVEPLGAGEKAAG